MADQFTEITTQSWGSRLTESLMAPLIGIIIFIAAFPLLIWNEGSFIDRIKTLDEGKKSLIMIDSATVDPKNEGKLVYMHGMTHSEDMVSDEEFGVSAKALKLIRHAEMFQWVENKNTEKHTEVGGTEVSKTTYNYKKEWSSTSHNSAEFKHADDHQNPEMPYSDSTYTAPTITVGAFTLAPVMVDKLDNKQPYALSGEEQNNIPPSDFKITDRYYYNGTDMAKPEVGDMRISYEIVPPATISLIGGQHESSIGTYTSVNGSIELLEIGQVDAATMFKAAQDENVIITWLIRLGGIVLMFFGIMMLFKPLAVLASVLPIFGSLIDFGAASIALIISLPLGFITIGFAWIAYRPVIGLIILASAAVIFIGTIYYKKQRAVVVA